MKLDELAFANQQLAGMLQAGLPLEGALRQLCASMRHGQWRTELAQLEADLTQGIPLDQALGARRLPGFYVAMLRAGVASHNLPGVLLMLADYYQQVHSVWTRLKGLMVYPVIVLVTSLVLSAALAGMYTALLFEEYGMYHEIFSLDGRAQNVSVLLGLTWLPVALTMIGAVAVAVALSVPRIRCWLRWKLPAFREASLAQFASAFAMMLSQGCQPRDALALLQRIESDQPLGAELARWQDRLAAGHARFTDMAAGAKIVPPLFVWLVASAGENWERGLRTAAELYERRAGHHIEDALYAALPVTILALGLMIVLQVYPFVAGFMRLFNALGDFT